MAPSLTLKHSNHFVVKWEVVPSSVRHPESDGLIERANSIIFLVITKSLFGLSKGKWPEELIKVVWNHNTLVSRSTSLHHSSFSSEMRQ
jgi:hypothetical protein